MNTFSNSSALELRPGEVESIAGTLMDGPGGPALLATRCSPCDAVFLPRRPLCPICRGPLSDAVVGGTGIVDDAVVCHVAPNGFAAPYTLGFVRIEGGCRILSPIVAAGEHAVSAEPGARVRLAPARFGNDPNGAAYVSWCYEIEEA